MRLAMIVGFVFLSKVFALAQVPDFKVLAFYNPASDPEHVAFAKETRVWMERVADERNFTFDVTVDPSNLNDRFLKNYQLVMWLTDIPTDTDQRRAFERFVGSGGRWIGFHRSLETGKKPWPWFESFSGASPTSNSSWPPVPIRVVPGESKHEILNGSPVAVTMPANEWLQWSTNPNRIDVIWSVDSNEFPFGMIRTISKGPVPVLWTNTQKNMVYFNLGHDPKSISDFFVNRVIENAVVWLGNGKTPREIWKTHPSNLPTVVFVEGGSFTMGDRNGEKDEQPEHKVELSSFYIGRTEVTRAQWRAYCQATGRSMPERAWFKQDEDHPVINVSWDQAVAYCVWLSEQTGKKYRLPTEAEWEFAARGGIKSNGYAYSGGVAPDSVGWVGRKTEGTQPVAKKKPNELGIFDMTGNVWEWCSDWYDPVYYQSASSSNPQGPVQGKFFTFRGGAWDIGARNSRVTYRNPLAPTSRNHNKGFRVASEP